MPGPIGFEQFLNAVIAEAMLPEESTEDESGWLDWSVFHPAGSTAIETVRHRLRDGQMTVRFAQREMYPNYLFWDVPRELFNQWKRVKSAGKFYHRRIKGGYGI